MLRLDGRRDSQIRDVNVTIDYQPSAEGSVLISMGNTRVLCAATVEERVPKFLSGQKKGWVTAEYSMLPRSTVVRTPRSAVDSGRSAEIRRLIGRCLRVVTDLSGLGGRTIIIDCDVILADGGTRTAAITGGYLALYQAIWRLVHAQILNEMPNVSKVAAVSVGLVGGRPLLDLCYEEDHVAEVDFNLAMTDSNKIVEIQGSAERGPFAKTEMVSLMALAEEGIDHLFNVQDAAISKIRSSQL